MPAPDCDNAAGVSGRECGQIVCAHRRTGGQLRPMLIAAFLVLLAVAAVAWGQASDDDGFPDINRRGFEQIDRIEEALRRYGRIFLWVAAGLTGVIILKIISPVQIYYGAQEGRLRRAVNGVDELLKRIQKEAEATNDAPKEETAVEGGVLAGMAEIAEFEQAEQVPSYVLTVNDLMLDNIGTSLRKLLRFRDANAEKYQNNMFTVIHGIKTITEQSAEANVPSGLAVDIRDYCKDERRFKVWRKTLGRWARRKGQHQETANAFLVFMRNVREGRPLAVSKPAAVSLADTAVTAAVDVPAIPETLSEETLAAVQEAAVEEARSFCAFIEKGTPPEKAGAWQFELVNRQQQIRTRDDAQRMLNLFLSCERKALQEITRIKMLPCRTWGHVLHLLGVADTAQLRRRVEDRLLLTQEIVILEKAFLQTFARRESLVRVYTRPGQEAGLMIDVHVPEIRREALALLRRLHETEPGRLDTATDALNEEETPRNGQVRKLIEHYMK